MEGQCKYFIYSIPWLFEKKQVPLHPKAWIITIK